MFFRLSPQSGVPMYLQLVEQVRHGVETGALRAGDQLPTLRTVAEALVVNPNTVAKAYREMEHAGLIVLRQGAGAFVAAGLARAEPRAVQKGRTVVRRTVETLRDLGLDDGAIRRLVDTTLAEEAEPTGVTRR
ncbi:MAG TPA: GntR family transcriptional regulator [Vicinamibacterales bacterium]|jgi:GntR family transcriptional regulator|nr:GntR family transcriptional regulator [Vicinamibacterales bacterium]